MKSCQPAGSERRPGLFWKRTYIGRNTLPAIGRRNHRTLDHRARIAQRGPPGGKKKKKKKLKAE
jgi:hypothetical protein